MATYLVIGDLSQQGSAGLLEQGFAARLEQFKTMVAEQGATVDGYWLNEQGQSVVLLSYEGPWQRALGAVEAMASGAWRHLRTMELFDAELLDEHRAGLTGYTPPGD